MSKTKVNQQKQVRTKGLHSGFELPLNGDRHMILQELSANFTVCGLFGHLPANSRRPQADPQAS